MKKKYTKPVIMYESFMLCTNIAAGCEFIANSVQDSCGYEVRGRAVFIDSSTGCVTHAQYDVSLQDYTHNIYNNTVCYHVPVETTNLFSSG